MTRGINRNRVPDYDPAQPETRECTRCEQTIPPTVEHLRVSGIPGCVGYVITYETLNGVTVLDGNGLPLLRIKAVL